MVQLPERLQTQTGGACTTAERDELDDHLLSLPVDEALQTLMELQATRVGAYEYTLAIGRLYEHSQIMQRQGFPPSPSNVFWKHVQSEADELNLSSVEHMVRAMSHVESRAKDHYHRAHFEIRFLQKPALWWQKLYELTHTLDDQIYEAPVPLLELKRILSDAALDKLTESENVEDLLPEHLLFAKQEALKSFSERRETSFVGSLTYEELGFEIGKSGWIQRVDISLKRKPGRQAKKNQTITLKTGQKAHKQGWKMHRRTQNPY